MDYKSIVETVSKETDIPIEVVDLAYKSSFGFIKDKIINLPLKDNLSEEDFKQLRTNFNLPSLGKLTCTYDRYLGVKERLKYIKEKQNGNKED